MEGRSTQNKTKVRNNAQAYRRRGHVPPEGGEVVEAQRHRLQRAQRRQQHQLLRHAALAARHAATRVWGNIQTFFSDFSEEIFIFIVTGHGMSAVFIFMYINKCDLLKYFLYPL